MRRQITLADIARKSKCSVATVSLVLRDKPGISPATRGRVLAAARSLGYHPRPGLANFPLEMPPLLSEPQADGFPLLGALVDETLFRLLGDTSRPVVLVTAYADVAQYDSVVSDNLNGAYQATCALIARGHRPGSPGWLSGRLARAGLGPRSGLDGRG